MYRSSGLLCFATSAVEKDCDMIKEYRSQYLSEEDWERREGTGKAEK